MDAPLIVRLAGLDASALECFRERAPSALVDAASLLEADLRAAREELIGHIHAALPGAPAASRGALLAVRRDLFNGRSVRHRSDLAAVASVAGPAGEALGRVLDLEGRCAALAAEFEAVYHLTVQAQRAHLVALAAAPEVRRGLALASPALCTGVERIGLPGFAERKARKLEASLARYVSRAATKLSPFSTFTLVGLSTVDPSLAAPHLVRGERGSGSCVRLKRYLLRQVVDTLESCAAFRNGLEVTLNNTLERLVPEGRLRFLRPARWRWNAETRRVTFVHDALVEVNLGGPLVEFIQRRLREPGAAFVQPALAEAARAELAPMAKPKAARAQIARALEQLLEIGFLILLPPWPVNSGHLEKSLLVHLRGLGAPLAEVADVLGEIVALEESYAASADPAADVRRVEDRLAALWQATARAAGHPDAPAFRAPKGNLHEDVFVFVKADSGAGRGGEREVARLPRRDAAELTALARPLATILGLSRSAHELGHLVEAFAAGRWPGRHEIGLLELFSAFQPMWQSFLEAGAAVPRGGTARAGFNPMGLRAVDRLDGLRRRIRGKLAALCDRIDERSGEHRLDPQRLAALAAEIPQRYRFPVGVALCVQPAGDFWVVNNVLEGVGRVGSRFTPSMPESLADLWTESLSARGVLLDEREKESGPPLDLLDLMCVGGDTLNVHAVQTRRVLELPGEPVAVDTGRRVSLAELRIRLTAWGPRLVDAGGRCLLPVHLGVAAHLFMPSLVKFLSSLGPGPLTGPLPGPPPCEFASGVHYFGRLLLGRLVLQRRTWRFGPAAFPELRGRSDAAVFTELHRWRRRYGLPSRVFVLERRGEGLTARSKPQYLDLRSPVFLAILRRALETVDAERGLVIVEMLPTPEMYPIDRDGRPRAVEWVIDALALSPREMDLAPGAAARQPSCSAFDAEPIPAPACRAPGGSLGQER